jgi:hypothetical protein
VRATFPVLWAPDDLLAAHDAWLAGWGDLPYVAAHRPVPVIVQLGVLTHAPWPRLDGLRTAAPWSRAAATWRTVALQLVNRVLLRAGNPSGLADLQRSRLRPLERQLLDAGRMDLDAAELSVLLDRALSPQPVPRSE